MSDEFRIGFCVSGQGRLFQAAVRRFRGPRAAVAHVVLDHTAAPGLEAFCADHGVTHARHDAGDRAGFQAALAQGLRDARLDLTCLTFDRIVAAETVAEHRGRMINVHPGLLPAFAGTHAIDRAVSSGARFLGATVHEVTAEVDAGPIIAQCVTGLAREDTVEQAGARMYALLEPMLLQVLGWYAQGRVTRDGGGRVWIEGATYGALPVSPALEPPG